MVLSNDEALVLVRTWIREQQDLPQGSFVTVAKKNQCFKIKWRHPVHEALFDLLIVKVDEESQIRIIHSWMEFFKKVSEDNFFGFSRETKFLNAFQNLNGLPKWLIKVERAHPFLDRRGVDAFAQIRLGDGDTLKVPVQIKSSAHGKSEFFKKQPLYRDVIVGIVIKNKSSNEDIRHELVSALGVIRKKINRGAISLADVKSTITKTINY